MIVLWGVLMMFFLTVKPCTWAALISENWMQPTCLIAIVSWTLLQHLHKTVLPESLIVDTFTASTHKMQCCNIFFAQRSTVGVCVRFYKYSAKFLKATLTVATTWLSLPAQVAIEAHHGWRLQVSEKQQTQCITHWIPLGFCSWIPKINRTLNTPGYLVDMWKVLIFILVLFDYVFNVRFILGIQEQKPNGIQWVIHWVCCFSLTCSLQPWCASIATCAGNESQVVATVRVAFKHLAKYFKKKIQE